MKKHWFVVGSLIFSGLFCLPATAAQSVYSKLDFDKGCQWEVPASEEEAGMGGSAVCSGYKDYPVYFTEGDLRQFVTYGFVDDPKKIVGGFAQWNSVHTTIEWRLEGGEPYATIHRWFLDNINPDTGAADQNLQGQVLVISSVGNPNNPPGQRNSCPVGYVDALANNNANVIARQVADGVAKGFDCNSGKPQFYGIRGPKSGQVNGID